jgi:murein peptide amidase A
MLFKLLMTIALAHSIAYGQDLHHLPTIPVTVPLKEIIAPQIFPVAPDVKKFCNELEQKFVEYKWGPVQCEDFEWNNVRKSAQGTPLIWTTFGVENSPAAKRNTTLVLCGVHGDEITPVKFCWDLIRELKKNIYKFDDKMVVIAPLVTPDSFFKDKPTRTNGAGVDVNRNFPTRDWLADAHKKWKHNYGKDKRKYPGPRAASEQETIFQMNLIKRYRPNKVITVHAPLTLLDYDGPSLKAVEGKSAKSLLEQMSKKSFGYKVSNYPIFPGSLGNWAGKENHIATYTLELPNTNPLETDKFWNLFKDALIYAIDHKMQPTVD